MRRRALDAAFDLDGAFSSVSVTLAGNAQPANVIAALDILLAPFAGVGAYAREDQISHASIESELQQLRRMARVIPPAFLVVSAILIHAILSRLIATERQQIGLLKAFGYTRSAVTAAEADLRRWRADRKRAEDDLNRTRTVAETGTASRQALERVETAFSTLSAATQQARAALDLARHVVSRAEAALMPAGARAGGDGLPVTAPITGVV
ncbi:hypothetical protein [Hyphomonas sp.]|uniref:hypothetical protein n=1 Tax=Hyphomonas sp. TaxID=87 RepID=UPI0035660BF4